MESILYLGCVRPIISYAATKMVGATCGLLAVVNVYCTTTDGIVYRVYDLSLMTNELLTDANVVAFVAGIVVGVNTLHLVNLFKKKHKLSHRGKK